MIAQTVWRVGSKPMLGTLVFSKRQLPRAAEDGRNFDGPGLAPVDHAISADNDFADICSVSLGYDAARFRKMP